MLPVLLAYFVLRCLFAGLVFPNPDEAYYWLWGQHPDWSYYDHPPFVAWVQGWFTAWAGRSLGLRLSNWLSSALVFYTYFLIVRYLYPDRVRARWGQVVLAVLASPLYFLFLALAWPDHWLIAFALMGSYQFIRFADAYQTTQQGPTWRLYIAAWAIGLALLCKYNAVFVLLGWLGAVTSDRALRPLWRDRRFYIAGAIVGLALVPIGIWNAAHDWLSLRYYVDRSVMPGQPGLKLGSLLGFLLVSVLLLSPFHCGGVYRALTRPHPRSLYRSVALWVFLVSTVTLLGVSLRSAALYYWNITAYLLLFPLLPTIADGPSPHPGWRTQAYGLLFAVLLVIHYGGLPLSALVSRTADPDSRMLYGWDRVAAIVRRDAATLGTAPLLLTTDYRSAAALAYQLNDRSVLALSDRRDQFDIWAQRRSDLPGRSAVIVADEWHPLQTSWTPRFDHISAPTIVPVVRGGRWIKQYFVFRGYGLRDAGWQDLATSPRWPGRTP